MNDFHSDHLARHAGSGDRLALHHDIALDVWENEGGGLGPVRQPRSAYGDRRDGYEPARAL